MSTRCAVEIRYQHVWTSLAAPPGISFRQAETCTKRMATYETAPTMHIDVFFVSCLPKQSPLPLNLFGELGVSQEPFMHARRKINVSVS